MDYNKKLRLAKEALASGFYDKETIEYIFPELKESEDEKIRKDIIIYLQYSMAFDKSFLDKKYNWSQKDCSKWIAWLENQGEQKPADNEPKFRAGDWVVDNCGYIWKIEEILNQFYLLEGIEGGESRPTIEWVNKTFHLWTVQDAKDGDVLLFEGNYNSIVLFHGIGINGKGRINYHCKCDLGNYSFGVQGNTAFLGTIEKDAEHYHPATKEQRDLLFSKMKEKGYEWDAVKKELKKIEQKPTGEEMKEALRTEYEKGRADAIAEMQKPVEPQQDMLSQEQYSKAVDECIYGEQKPTEKVDTNLLTVERAKKISPFMKSGFENENTAWSEEDKTKIKSIIAFLKSPSLCAMDGNKGIIDESIKYLNSLKDRVQPQPKQEWSEKDEENFARVDYACLKVYGGDSYSSDWLRKFLGIHKKWKPSEGQLECLGYAIDKAEKDWSPLTNNRIYLTLKALKEQLLELIGSKV